MRVIPTTIATDLVLDQDVAIPSTGSDLQAYAEGILTMVVTVTNGSWAFTVQTYDGHGNWFEIKDAFGQSTSRTFGVAADQKAVWQLAYYGKSIRVYADATGADQDAVVKRLDFQAKG